MFTRRAFLSRFGGLGAATAAIYALPEVLRIRGLWSPAYALDLDAVRETYDAFAAMLWPGSDVYSLAQGESALKPGAVAAGAGRAIVAALDQFVPAPDMVLSNDLTVPLSGLIASAINSAALTVQPAALNGLFLTPYARLNFRDKTATWRRLEEDTLSVSALDPTHSLGVLQFVFGNLPAFVNFLAFSEADVFDPAARKLKRRPVGWNHSGYLGTSLVAADGWDEFKGYYRNRKQALNP